MFCALIVPLIPATRSEATISGVQWINRSGLDSCQVPTAAQEYDLWYHTSFWMQAFYFGGATASVTSCASTNPQTIAANINMYSAYPWLFMPIWDDRQAPCTGNSQKFSYDTSTAYNQGVSDAISAYNAETAVGIDHQTVVTLDVETWDVPGQYYGSPCDYAAYSYIKGFLGTAEQGLAMSVALYSSPTSLSWFLDHYFFEINTQGGNIPIPTEVWGAHYDSNPDPWALAPLPQGAFVFHQRIKQWQGPAPAGQTGFLVDRDCADAYADGSWTTYQGGCQ